MNNLVQFLLLCTLLTCQTEFSSSFPRAAFLGWLVTKWRAVREPFLSLHLTCHRVVVCDKALTAQTNRKLTPALLLPANSCLNNSFLCAMRVEKIPERSN